MQEAIIQAKGAQPAPMAANVRRSMLQMPEVARALNPVESLIFRYSTKISISEMGEDDFRKYAPQVFERIARDVGYNIPADKREWASAQTRLSYILRLYYPNLALSEVKLAFELSVVGELDQYLAKDSQGNPDRKHYQQFNAEYFAKILNAYLQKRGEVIGKAYRALPKPDNGMSPEQERLYHNEREARNREIYLCYKYTGKMCCEPVEEMFVYSWLLKHGLAGEVKETPDDRRQALARYLKRAAMGLVNEHRAFHVRRTGEGSPELDSTAYEVARGKEIRKAFDRMIAGEMQVDDYLNFL